MLSLSKPVEMMFTYDKDRAIEMAVENITYLEELHIDAIAEREALRADLIELQKKYDTLYDRMYAPSGYIKEG